MRDVVCLDLPAGLSMVERISRAWDEGDAVFPLDDRLPGPQRTRLLAAARPTVVATLDGDLRLDGEPAGDGDALLVATSGSTGEPRVAVLGVGALAASATAVTERLRIGPGDRWFACLPVAHVGGFSVISRALLTGTALSVVPRFSPEAYVEAAGDGCTLTSLVVTALARVDPSLFRAVLIGGSAAPDERAPNVIATYGMTETGGGVVYDGRPLTGVEMRVDDSGEIHLRCPMLLRCYRDGTSPLLPNGWYPTGDLGAIAADGRLEVHGRHGERIVTGGEKVWPQDVEHSLLVHPAVAEACVAGVDDPQWGQAVHAWVVPVGGEIPTLEQLRSHVKETLPAYCAPKALHLVEAIPRTALGKPRREALVASLIGD